MIIKKDMGEFSASHTLPTHKGGCGNCHGHNYRVAVSIIGEVDDDTKSESHGMVIDFTEIKDIYKKYIHEIVDHSLILAEGNWPEWYTFMTVAMRKTFDLDSSTPYDEAVQLAVDRTDRLLGKVAHLQIENTTAENLAKWVCESMSNRLSQHDVDRPIRIFSVEVFETSTSSAIYINPPTPSIPKASEDVSYS